MTMLGYLLLLFISNSNAASVKFVAMGDVPYNLPKDEPRFSSMIKEANQIKPDFAVHVGDIKAGSSECSNKALQDAFNRFSKFLVPLIYTPGDNEWTDCHRDKAGNYDPIERLAFLRKLFFSEDSILGHTQIKLLRQSKTPEFKEFIENALWSIKDIGFATIHVVGSNNGFIENNPDLMSELKNRTRANLEWLNVLFKQARELNQKAVIIIMHGDPKITTPDFARSGYHEIIDAFNTHGREFKKPILLIHGDSHIYTFEKFLGMKNFTRLIVPGAPTAQSVEVSVDTSSVEPFAVKLLKSF